MTGAEHGGHRLRELRAKWAEFSRKSKLNTTQQRQVIVEVFLRSQEHVSAEDLLANIRKRHGKVGYATVYRTLRLLVDGGLATARQFGDGQTRYEVAGAHHDHLICEACGLILEFEDTEIERLQEAVARKLGGFRVLRHKHELYGLCPKAQGVAGGSCPNESRS